MSKINENQVKTSANDQYLHHNGSERLYKYTMGFHLTEGVMEMAEKVGLFWLADIVVSYQPQLKQEEFQVWKLEKNGNYSAVVTCDNGNGKILKRQAIEYTDCPFDTVIFWFTNGTILLPSEY